MAVCEEQQSFDLAGGSEPVRDLCPTCARPVLLVTSGDDLLVVDVWEWEPRGRCESCQRTRAAHPGKTHISCARCGSSGYVGTTRPRATMVAIDVAWGEEHVRVIGPNTDRRPGEALHPFHICSRH